MCDQCAARGMPVSANVSEPAKDYERLLEQSNRQQEEIEMLRAMLKDVNAGLDIVEAKLAVATAADPADAPFPLVGGEAGLWHRAAASAYLHALEMCNSTSLKAFVTNGFRHDKLSAPPQPPR